MERDRLLLYFGMMVLGIILLYIFLASWWKPEQDLSPFMIAIGGTMVGYYWGAAKAYKAGETENNGSKQKTELLTKKDAASEPKV